MERSQPKREIKRESLAKGGGETRGNENGTAPNWDPDAEHFHMLSYFMGGDPSAGLIPSHGDGLVTADGASVPSGPETMNTSIQPNTGSNSSSAASLHAEPPPTPAVQFYSHRLPPGGGGANTSPGLSSTGRAPPLTASSSSSSLSSMAAALVSGGPVVHSMFNGSAVAGAVASGSRKESPISPSMMRISPISPAAIIGSGQENLMLPPPRRAPSGNGNDATVSSLPQQQAGAEPPLHPAHDPEQKQRHLAWLQHINSLAMKTAQQGQTPQQSQALQPPPALTTAIPTYQAAAPIQQGVPITMNANGTPVILPAPSPNAGESEERRARRLKRNRESARQSRRRKKEHLAKLEEQVNRLHVEIETNRRKQIVAMEPQLTVKWERQVDSIDPDGLALLMEHSSPNSSVRRGVISFQYAALKQLLLPKYQEFLLWLTLHPDAYFLAGKEENARIKAADKTSRLSSNRMSSKQIGEELSGQVKAKGKKKGSKKQGAAVADEKASPTSKAMDAARMWPLFCYEMSISVDQEEKLLQAQKKSRQLPNLPNDRSQMAVATRMSSNMRHGVLYQAHTTEHRRMSSLLHTLTPEQSIKYLRWFTNNRDRCSAVLQTREARQRVDIKQEKIKTEDETQAEANKELSLNEVCLKLERVLRIPETDEIKKEDEA